MHAVEEELTMDDEVERLYSAMIEAMRQTRPLRFDAPVTVAEIYQDLVPYRSVRAALGFDMNADYEHTLLRLLAGEAELVRLEPDEARAELRRELDSPNPNVGLFRKFAACDVWITPPQATPAHAAAPEPEPAESMPSAATERVTATPPKVPAETGGSMPVAQPADRAPAVSAPTPAAAPEPPRAAAPAPARPPAEKATPAADASLEYELVPARQPAPTVISGPQAAAAHCAFCDSAIPGRNSVRFCPFCGTDQTHRPCSACGEALEPGWRFCVACGAATEAGA